MARYKLKSKDFFSAFAEESKKYNVSSGRAGEYFTEVLLKQLHIKYEKWPQEILPLSKSMSRHGGKRPDFIASISINDKLTTLLIDSKYHKTKNCTEFYLSDDEISKYTGLINYFLSEYSGTSFEFCFLLFPKEDSGRSYYTITLEDFIDAEISEKNGAQGRKINLTGMAKTPCTLFHDE
jgi:hypothetical protein